MTGRKNKNNAVLYNVTVILVIHTKGGAVVTSVLWLTVKVEVARRWYSGLWGKRRQGNFNVLMF